MRPTLSLSAPLFALLLLAACGRPPSDPAPAPAPPVEPAVDPGLVPGEHSWTTADGVALPYEVAGDGDPTVVLVHCWMCDRTFWDDQVPVLAERYRTIRLDLPGHGAAGSDRETWTVAGYGDDVAGLLGHLGLEDVVLVGHSMGGPVSLRAAALVPDRVAGIVAVDTLHDAEFDFSGPEVEQMMQAFEADFAGTCNGFIAQMFPEEGVEQEAAAVAAKSCDPGREVIGLALMHDFGTIPMTTWFEEAGVPIRAVNAAGPNPTKVESNRKYADFDAVLMEGVGHYPQMTRPEEFNPLLLAAIAEVAGGGSEPVDDPAAEDPTDAAEPDAG